MMPDPLKSPAQPQISIVVPLYNEQEIVDELVTRIVKAARGTGLSFEAVIVNDGSRDQTLPRLVVLSMEVPELRVINLLRNFGHMPALSAGVAAARGAAVIVMDGDLQDPPELIPRFIEAWRQGADVVYGLRTSRKERFAKRLAIGLFYRILDRFSETEIPRQVGTFGLMDRRIVDVMNGLPERNRYFAGLRAWAGGRQAFVPYERPDRADGASRVGIRGLFCLAATALTSFSKAPLRYASALSLFSGLLLLVVGTGAILVRLLTNLAVPGWATYTTLIGMMGFVQSIVLAVMAEYIAVIFDEVKARPLFLVREEYAHGRPVGASRPNEATMPESDVEPADPKERAGL